MTKDRKILKAVRESDALPIGEKQFKGQQTSIRNNQEEVTSKYHNL